MRNEDGGGKEVASANSYRTPGAVAGARARPLVADAA